MTIDELLAVLEMQEEILQFTHFTNEDAWELGSAMTLEARRRGLPVLISIRLNNGFTVFQYASDGANLQNESWIQRKFQTVRTLEHSTLYTCMLLKTSQETLEHWSLDPRAYAA